MLKKWLVLAAALGLSMSARADYIGYQLEGVTLSDGGTITGSFAQNTDNRAVMYYALQSGGGTVGQQYSVSGSMSNLQSAYTIFDRGPTSFGVFGNVDDMLTARLNLDFGWDTHAARYTVGGSELAYESSFGSDGLRWNSVYRTITGGTLVEGAVDPNLLAWLESDPDPDGIHIIVPAEPANPNPKALPEPGSLALLAGGVAALAALAALRRRVRGAARGAVAA